LVAYQLYFGGSVAWFTVATHRFGSRVAVWFAHVFTSAHYHVTPGSPPLARAPRLTSFPVVVCATRALFPSLTLRLHTVYSFGFFFFFFWFAFTVGFVRTGMPMVYICTTDLACLTHLASFNTRIHVLRLRVRFHTQHTHIPRFLTFRLHTLRSPRHRTILHTAFTVCWVLVGSVCTAVLPRLRLLRFHVFTYRCARLQRLTLWFSGSFGLHRTCLAFASHTFWLL